MMRPGTSYSFSVTTSRVPRVKNYYLDAYITEDSNGQNLVRTVELIETG